MVSGLLLTLVNGPFVKMATFLTIRRTNHDNHDDQIIKHEIGQHFQSYNVRPSDLFQFFSLSTCPLRAVNCGAKIHLF